MATTYKSLSTNDIVTTKTLLHEAIPITGSIVSGTYVDSGTETSIKNYTHGMFQSVYDYPYLSSSANHIFDLTAGCHATSEIVSSSGAARTGLTQGTKKINIYNQMAQVLMGYDETGNIRKFDLDGDLSTTTTDKIFDAVFINFSRLITKDEIKKGTFSVELGLGESFTSASATVNSFSTGSSGTNTAIAKLYDKGASTDYRVNSPAGEYGILYASSSNADLLVNNNTNKVGLIFYQAGIAVIDAGIFHNTNSGSGHDTLFKRGYMDHTNTAGQQDPKMNASSSTNSSDIVPVFVSASITHISDAVRHRINKIEFNNTTELNSTVYFCRAHHNEFNYSTNPTYLSGSKIVVKNTYSDTPLSYITTVGLYSADNELLAVAKVSEPLKKDPTNELTLRVRLDY